MTLNFDVLAQIADDRERAFALGFLYAGTRVEALRALLAEPPPGMPQHHVEVLKVVVDQTALYLAAEFGEVPGLAAGALADLDAVIAPRSRR